MLSYIVSNSTKKDLIKFKAKSKIVVPLLVNFSTGRFFSSITNILSFRSKSMLWFIKFAVPQMRYFLSPVSTSTPFCAATEVAPFNCTRINAEIRPNLSFFSRDIFFHWSLAMLHFYIAIKNSSFIVALW